ncbi:hypothetical protein BH24DEI2_BH24DEI2_17750 [soil metagenome]
MDDLLRLVRTWIIYQKIGLMSKEEVVQQVDKKIVELAKPPGYLFSVSLSESLNHIKELDLLEYPIDDSESTTVAQELLLRLEAREISYDALGACAFHMMILTSDEALVGAWAAVESTLHYVNIGEADLTEEVTEFVCLELKKLASIE